MDMKLEALRHKIEVMQAACDGKNIQIRQVGDGDWDDIKGIPTWDWEFFEYRVKPAPPPAPARPEPDLRKRVWLWVGVNSGGDIRVHALTYTGTRKGAALYRNLFGEKLNIIPLFQIFDDEKIVKTTDEACGCYDCADDSWDDEDEEDTAAEEDDE